MRLVARAAEEFGNDSVRLEGGTALAAYYLGHRESEDLDFFSDIGVNEELFGETIRELGEAEGLRTEMKRRSATFAQLFVSDAAHPGAPALKLDLAAQSPYRLASPEATTEGIRVASFRDLAANKLHVICDRVEARDYIDLHAILTREISASGEIERAVRERTRELVRDVMEIDPGLDPRFIGNSVSRGLDQPILPRFPLQVFVPITEAEVRLTLELCAGECAQIVAESLQE